MTANEVGPCTAHAWCVPLPAVLKVAQRMRTTEADSDSCSGQVPFDIELSTGY